MFARTNRGLSNEHQFHGVELVVYCEGTSFEDETASLDELFWTRAFSVGSKMVKCKSIGSKDILRELATKVANDDIKNVVVAMDRDYDDLRGLLVNHRRVLYTYGYSWENDVVIQVDFDSAISLFVTVANTDAMQAEFEEYLAQQSDALRRVFALDFKYIGHEKSLFDRNKPLSIVECSGTPHVKRNVLVRNAAKLGKFQTEKLAPGIYNTPCGLIRFFGKTVGRLIYHWFVHRTKSMSGKRSVRYEAFMALLATNLEFGSHRSERDQHYAEVISAV